MDRKTIEKFSQLWQEVAEKKKLDPVGKADADIDNDGDVDSSDEYLHKRRKAIKKSMKEEDDITPDKDGMKPCPECDGSMDNHDPDCPKADSDSKEESSCGLKASTKGQMLTRAARRDLDAKKAAKKVKKESIDMTEFATFLEALTAKKSSQKGGTSPEGMMDKESPTGKKMAADADYDKSEVDDTEEQGHDDASKAGRAVKTQAKARNGDQLNVGDKKMPAPKK